MDKPMFWSKNSQVEPKTLRPPKSLIQNQNAVAEEAKPSVSALESQVQPSPLKHMEDVLAKSILKADAPEWYPRNIVNQQVQIQVHSVQDRLNIHKKKNENIGQQSSHSAPSTAFRQNTVNIPAQHAENTWFNNGSTNGENKDIRRLRQIVTTLTKDPGQFDNLLDIFMETIYPHLNDITFLSHFTKLLVEQAISSANFRYTAARLCWCIEQNSLPFRAELHLICKKKLDDKLVTHDVLLLIAELYIQLPHLEVYSTLLIECMTYLINEGGEANIKFICQALKLTGYNLERSNMNDLNGILNQLIQLEPQLHGSASALLKSVLMLRQNNWGHSVDDYESDPESEEYNSENRVVYQQDGQILSTEESAFIAAHEEYLSDPESNPDELCDPEPEMDPEIQAAFKEFVEYSYNNK